MILVTGQSDWGGITLKCKIISIPRQLSAVGLAATTLPTNVSQPRCKCSIYPRMNSPRASHTISSCPHLYWDLLLVGPRRRRRAFLQSARMGHLQKTWFDRLTGYRRRVTGQASYYRWPSIVEVAMKLSHVE